MSLDNIQLPSIVIQELFKHSLTSLETEHAIEENLPSSPFSILGKNKKNIVLLISNEETLYLPDEELNFLLGILSACQLTMEDVGILNIKKNKAVTYNSISQGLKAEKIFLFGVDPAEIALPLAFPHYQVQRYNNQTYLSAPLLSSFKNDKTEKGKLWNCLKQIFSI